MIKYICDHCGAESTENNLMQVVTSAHLEGKKYCLCKECFKKYDDLETKCYSEMYDTLYRFLTEGQNR